MFDFGVFEEGGRQKKKMSFSKSVVAVVFMIKTCSPSQRASFTLNLPKALDPGTPRRTPEVAVCFFGVGRETLTT